MRLIHLPHQKKANCYLRKYLTRQVIQVFAGEVSFLLWIANSKHLIKKGCTVGTSFFALYRLSS